MKIRFRLVFEGITEQEPEWYREEGEQGIPNDEETLVRLAAWIREAPITWLAESDLIDELETKVELEKHQSKEES